MINHLDFGTLEREEYSPKDCFDMDIEVGFDVSKLSTTIQAMPVKVTLVAIFEDKLVFQGQNGSMTFFEEPRAYVQ